MKTKVASDKSQIVTDLPRACQDETAAVEFMEAQRWGKEPACPRCGDMDVYQMRDRATGERSARFLWRCRGCGRQYTVRVGTIMEDSPIPLRHWCYAFWAACASKKGVSALQIKRMTGLTYKSALFMMHRIRFAMADTPGTKLGGIVEADETFCGGKPRNKGIRSKGKVGRASDKVPVIGVLQRGDDVRAMPVERLDAAALRDFILKNVDTDSILMTDESNPYTKIGKKFLLHGTVNHSQKQYAKPGHINVNGIESFWAIVKRALYGTHHAVSRKHLHRYISERAFVFNGRHMDDGARTVLAIRKAEGKRLMYREAKAGA